MFNMLPSRPVNCLLGFLLTVTAVVLFFANTADAKNMVLNHPVKRSVIINEVMWMGSVKSSVDEWVELRNVTGQDIDLSGFVLENGGDSGNPNLIIPPGKVILANSYFLIANYAETNSKSALNAVVDWVTNDISLANDGEQLTLRNAAGVIIDQTPEGKWPAGVNEPLNKRSMERKLFPGDGTIPANWKTCNAGMCHFTSYWDTLGINWGTPKAPNL